MNRYLRKNSATILSICAGAGVVFTAVLVAKETPKAEKLLDELKSNKENPTLVEKAITLTPVYLPAIAMGGVTIACIFGANILNKKQQALLTSAYGFMNQTFKEYREKLIELYGEEADEKIQEEIFAVRRSAYHQIHVSSPDEMLEFYEPFSNTFFKAYEREVMDAEYHINRNFVLGGIVSLNQYFDMLGIAPINDEENDSICWDIEDGYYWIDFDHEEARRPDGSVYYIISPVYPPEKKEDLPYRLW